jgi:hypothetical protein
LCVMFRFQAGLTKQPHDLLQVASAPRPLTARLGAPLAQAWNSAAGPG